MDSNSFVRTQNESMISSSLRNPGLYFLTGIAMTVGCFRLPFGDRRKVLTVTGAPPIL